MGFDGWAVAASTSSSSPPFRSRSLCATITVRIDPNKFKAAIAGTSGDQFHALLRIHGAELHLALTGYERTGASPPGHQGSLPAGGAGVVHQLCVFDSTLGFPLVTGGRGPLLDLRTGGALRGARVASLTIVAGITFWLGMGLVVGAGFLSASDPVADIDHFHPLANRLISAGNISALITPYLAWVASMRWRNATVLGDFKLPGPMLTLGQMALGVIDICSASAALYVLLPQDLPVRVSPLSPRFTRSPPCSASPAHAPGGLGVFDATILQGVRAPRTPTGLAPAFPLAIYLPVPFIAADGDAGRRPRSRAPLAFAARSDVGAVRTDLPGRPR